MAATVQTINDNECMGDSLPKINNNFQLLAVLVNTFKDMDTSSSESIRAALANLEATLQNL